jgi:hypothetical protein
VGIFVTGVGASSILVKYAGQDLTDHVQSITINQGFDSVEITAMGAVAKAYVPGLRDDSVDITFFNDYASSSVDATLYPYLGSTTGATLLIQTSGSTVSATQPSYSMTACLYNYTPVDGTVGTASMNKVTFKPAAGQYLQRATS